MPLASTAKRPFGAPLKVPLLVHSISAAVSVAWGPAQGAPGVPPYGVPDDGMQRGPAQPSTR